MKPEAFFLINVYNIKTTMQMRCISMKDAFKVLYGNIFRKSLGGI
jgi:hypothetical protein